jgi:hypothetical protein
MDQKENLTLSFGDETFVAIAQSAGRVPAKKNIRKV